MPFYLFFFYEEACPVALYYVFNTKAAQVAALVCSLSNSGVRVPVTLLL